MLLPKISGAKLILAARNVAALESVASAERARGHFVQSHALDQADEASAIALRDDVLKEHGRVDGLVTGADPCRARSSGAD